MPLQVQHNSAAPSSPANPDGSALFPLQVTGVITSGTTTAANIAHDQISVTTTATLLAAARPGRSHITVENHGTTQVFLGNANVTTTNGFLLDGTIGSAVTIPFTGALYGRVVTGTQTVSVLESY